MSNTIVTITGPSCSGKSTLVRMLMNTGKFTEVISTTTRLPRAGEVDGESYHFVSPEHFEAIEMLESVEFNGNKYGGSVAEFEDKFASGLIPVIVVEPSGQEQINVNANNKGWTVLNVFVHIDPKLQARRFLSRMCQDYRSILGTGGMEDYDKLLTEYSNRMATMQVTESQWLDQFRENSFILDRDPIIVHRFDSDTESEVLNQVITSTKNLSTAA